MNVRKRAAFLSAAVLFLQVVSVKVGTYTYWPACVTSCHAGQPQSEKSKSTDSKKAKAQTPKPKNKISAGSTKKSSVRTLTMPTEEKPDRFGKTKDDVLDLRINEFGTQILSKSGRAVHCWDIAGNKILHTFELPKRRLAYQKPTAGHAFLSPNTKIVGIFRELPDDLSEVALYESDNGKLIGKFSLGKKKTLYDASTPDAFTASGDYLLLRCGRSLGPPALFAIATVNAKGFLVQTPEPETRESPLELLIPHPTEPLFFLLRRSNKRAENPSGISLLNLKSQQTTAVAGITDNPSSLFFDRGLEISGDGKLLLMHSIQNKSEHTPSAIEVCDWKAGKRLCRITEDMVHYTNTHFSPDGKRFFVVRNADYFELNIGTGGTHENVPDRIELYEAASGNQLASVSIDQFGIKGDISASAISGDGRKLALVQGLDIHIIDFRTAFGVAPLTPIAAPVRQYAIPVGKEPRSELPSAAKGHKPATGKNPPAKSKALDPDELAKRRAEFKARMEKKKKELEKSRKSKG